MALHPFDWYSDGLPSFVPACGTPFPITGFANRSLSNWIQMHVQQLFLQLPATQHFKGIILGLPEPFALAELGYVRISESITVGTKPDVIELSPTVLVPFWCRRDIGKEFYTDRVHE
jgi:hypothetical protein